MDTLSVQINLNTEVRDYGGLGRMAPDLDDLLDKARRLIDGHLSGTALMATYDLKLHGDKVGTLTVQDSS